MSVHDEHRQRMKTRFLKEGMDHFADHEVLEILLFYAIPKKDTNPLAHALLERFGSLYAVFEASYEDLCGVSGVGGHTAMLLRMLPDILRRYQVSQAQTKTLLLKAPGSIADFLRPHFFGRTREEMFLLCLDDGGGILYGDVIFEGTINQVQIHTREILQAVISCGATNVILAHNHPKGLAVPSSDDMSATDTVGRALRFINARLIDHFIFSQGDCVSMRAAGYFKRLGDG